MELKKEIEQSADALEKLFYRATKERDAAKGPAKTRLRHITKNIDKALSLMEHAEDEIIGGERDDAARANQRGPVTTA